MTWMIRSARGNRDCEWVDLRAEYICYLMFVFRRFTY